MTTPDEIIAELHIGLDNHARMIDRISADLDINLDTTDLSEFASNINKLFRRINALEKENAERDALLAYAEELEVIINNEVDFGEIVVFNERTKHKVAHLLKDRRS